MTYEIRKEATPRTFRLSVDVGAKLDEFARALGKKIGVLVDDILREKLGLPPQRGPGDDD